MREVAKVVLEIAARLETQEDYTRIKQYFNEILKQEKFGDMELEIQDIFNKVNQLVPCKLHLGFDLDG